MKRIASAGASAPNLTEIGLVYGPLMRPVVRIQIRPNATWYEDTHSLITSDGSIIPATAPGSWGQLYSAGVM